MVIVSNTSPLIGLGAIGRLNLLQNIYGEIIIPQAVYDEVTALGSSDASAVAVQTFPWIKTIQTTNLALVAELQKKLDLGESEAIALAIELSADLLVIDDESGRKIARNLSIKLIGAIGILIQAKRLGLIPDVKSLMDDLINQAGYWIDKQLYNYVLQQVGE